ncbi:hypothetical protein FOA52_000358 [Chlamydomonas sp. UWO 241]|nr:hypothetical protein FOA52_000358 [Chlamydomonas sp. UWO 241]
MRMPPMACLAPRQGTASSAPVWTMIPYGHRIVMLHALCAAVLCSCVQGARQMKSAGADATSSVEALHVIPTAEAVIATRRLLKAGDEFFQVGPGLCGNEFYAGTFPGMLTPLDVMFPEGAKMGGIDVNYHNPLDATVFRAPGSDLSEWWLATCDAPFSKTVAFKVSIAYIDGSSAVIITQTQPRYANNGCTTGALTTISNVVSNYVTTNRDYVINTLLIHVAYRDITGMPVSYFGCFRDQQRTFTSVYGRDVGPPIADFQ